jgi:hypothetical protein
VGSRQVQATRPVLIAVSFGLLLAPMPGMRASLLILITMCLLLFQNCGKPFVSDHNEKDAATLRELQSLDSQIRSSIGLSCQSDMECDAIAAGHRACGGPSTFYVYSVSATDPSELHALVDEYTELQHQQNLESGVISTCEVLLIPNTACVQNRCVSVD